MDFYYFSLCHVCKKTSPDLKKCSSCKILFYCSREHQQQDWQKHKKICKAVAKTNKILTLPNNPTAEDVNHFKYSSALLWQCELKRQLVGSEKHMWMFPKMCAVCYSKEANLVCQVCMSTAYCSTEHQESHYNTHEKFCQSLKLCLVIYETVFKDEAPKDFSKIKFNGEAQCLPGNAEGVFNLMGFNVSPNCSKSHVDFLLMSECYCPVITMLYALEKSGFIQNRRGRKNKLTIHIVGCDVAEDKIWWTMVVEFLSHWILNLKITKLFLIGPQFRGEEKLIFNFTDCAARRYGGTIIRIESYYHDVVHFIAKPDLVVAFNSGLHEFLNTAQDTWKKSILKLIRYKGVPALLTAYNESELIKDVARFPQQHIKFYVDPQKNPYSNLRPIRNWEEGEDPVYYQNSHIAIIAKK